jgi:Ca2+-binding EF-hand superfamily protein
MGDANIESLGAAFLGADADGDGMIDGDDLRKALKDMDERTWFWDSARKVDVDRMMLVADLDHTGGMNFTEFVGACLYQSHADRGALPEEAFSALDDDRDGLVSVNDIRGLFRERDSKFLELLPEGRPFTLEEWIDVIENCSEYTDSVASTNDGHGSGGIFDLLSLKCCDSSVHLDEEEDEGYSRYVSAEPM